MSVLFLQLITGEQVVSDVRFSGDNDIAYFTKPVRLMISEGANHQPQVSFMPFCPFSKVSEFTIDRSDIVYFGEAEDQLANAYSQQFSKIIAPPSKSISTDLTLD